MLVYHARCNTGSNNSKNKKSNMKKEYKSTVKRKRRVSRVKATGSVGQKKKPKVRKKLTKKNKQFLEGLGLKVKQKR